MPTYDSYCRVCGKEHQYIRSIANYKDTPMCCGEKTIKEIRTAPDVAYESVRHFENYKCQETGQIVTSERQRREIMAKHDLIDARETGSAKDHIKKAKKIQAAKDAVTDQNVSVGWTDLQTT